jgi:hypothetical protein
VSDAELAGMIIEIHDRSRRTYGAPRVHAELARLGRRCGRKRVARLMRSQQLVGVHARRRWRRGRPDAVPAPDLVQRNFNPTGPDRLWAAVGAPAPTRDRVQLDAVVCRHLGRRVGSSTVIVNELPAPLGRRAAVRRAGGIAAPPRARGDDPPRDAARARGPPSGPLGSSRRRSPRRSGTSSGARARHGRVDRDARSYVRKSVPVAQKTRAMVARSP